MSSLIFSLNATIPVFLLMILGMALRKLRMISEEFANDLNQFVFLIALPVMLFNNLVSVDFYENWDLKFVSYCFIVTLLSVLLTIGLSYLIKDKSVQGEFIQVAYRSNTTLLGIALINNIYGNTVMGPLMIIGCVPISNIMAVIVLSLFRENKTLNVSLIKETLKGIITNPIIIGIVIGLIWSLLKIPYPTILSKTVGYISNLASPLGLIALGALFNFKEAKGVLRESMAASFLRLIVYVILFMPIAIVLGFRGDQLIAILVILGASSAVSCYTMCRSMDYKGVLTSNTVMLTTLLCGFTLTFFIFILRSLGYI